MSKILSFALCGIAAACAQSAAAQNASPAAAAAGGSQLSGVTVADRRSGDGFVAGTVEAGTFRGADIMDVPATVNTVTREVFELQGATGIYDVLRNTAGVTRQQNGGDTFDQLVIRGIQVENRTNYRLNGALSVLNFSEIPLENKERVEVLKGASALYYGYTSPAGVINLVTKRAGAVPVSTVGMTLDQYGTAIGTADVGRRFGDEGQVGLRINAAGGALGSPYDRVDGSRRFLSAAFDWRLTNRLTVRADLEYYRKKITEQAGIALPAAAGGRIALPGIPDPKKLIAPEGAVFDATGTNVLVRADYALADDWALTVEAGHSEADRDRRLAIFQNYSNATGAGTIRGNVQNLRATTDMLRAEAFGTFATGAVRHELTLGAVRTDKGQDAIYQRNYSFAQNLYNPVRLGDIVLGAAPATPTTAALETRETGLYALDRLVLSPQWQLVAGLRHTRYTSEQGSNRYEAGKTTPLAALTWRATPDLSAYLSYSQGLEEGERAPTGSANIGTALPPGVSRQKELGLRWRAPTGTLLSAALFDIDRPGYYTNASNVYVADGQKRYRGLETSAQGRLTRALAWQASAQWLDAEFRNINASYNGRLPENTARQTASAFLSYDLPFAAGLSVNGGAYFTGKRPVNDLNQAWIGGSTLYSLGARYATRWFGRATTLQLNLDNAADKRYWAAAGTRLAVGAPRTLKAMVKVDL
jgi:iron complex outermembrane receptor protein